MTILSSVKISNPAADTLAAANNVLQLVTAIQSNPGFIANLGQQLTAAYALTQPEKDVRDAAVADEEKARQNLKDLEQKLKDTQGQIDDAKTTASASNKAAKDAADAYVKSANQTISERWSKLDAYKKELDDREIEIADRETAATAAEAQNVKDANANSILKNDLTNFANALRAFAPNVPVLEQTATE